MKGALIAAFFERDLSAAEEQELGRMLADSVEAAEEFAEKAADFYGELGLPDPKFPEEGGLAGGTKGGGLAPAGGSGAAGGAGPGAILSLGKIYAVLGAGVLIGGSATYYLLREPAVPVKAVTVKAQPAPKAPAQQLSLDPVPARKVAPESVPVRPKPTQKPESLEKGAGKRDVHPEFAGDKLVVRVVLQETSPVRVRIFGQDGAVLYENYAGMLAAGKYAFSWDGLDASGRPAPPGDYRVVVESNGGVSEKFIQIRQKIEELKEP